MMIMRDEISELEQAAPRIKTLHLIPGLVSRLGSKTSNPSLLMSLEAQPNSSLDIFTSHIDTRHSVFQNRRWVIKDVAGEVCGFLSQPKDGYYRLEKTDRTGELVEVMKIHYKYHGIYKVLTENPAREADVSILGGAPLCSNETCGGADGKPKSLFTAGRGRIRSSKNMQLLNSDGKIVLQFVKWDTDEFHIDYK